MVISDTPLAPYFSSTLDVGDLEEVNIEIIRNTLHRAYIEDFANFCKSLGGVTAETMLEVLSFEADRRSINITLNSLDTELTKDDRAKLYPNLGALYPEGVLRLRRCDDREQVKSVIESFPVYRALADFVPVSRGRGGGSSQLTQGRGLEDAFFEKEV